ncbi:hypothetical protein ACJIZ3_022738 [Penstemon smallii]|uniref:BING4 C-terminal domain-containing protein n=1 Tax=Penstemon smallii TaxID=265156 RepID=A0ABD3TP59_9LAMI
MGVKVVNDGLIDPVFSVEQGNTEEEEMKVKKFLRGEVADLKFIKDKKLKGQLEVREELYVKSAKAAAKADKWLMPSEGGFLEPEGIEKTWRIRQEAIGTEVDLLSQRNQYDIVLPDLGPYTLDFTTSGRYMVAAGKKGHLALMDMKNMNLIKEFQVREKVRDVVFLHNQKLFAAAQKKYVYIYSENGTEVHCLKEHGAATKLQFLNKHFLLTSINKRENLRFQDITTGKMIGSFRTGLGHSKLLEVNPFNHLVAVGHSSGTVTMWKPTSATSVYQIHCHPGIITAMAFHSNGHLMATAGMERKIKLWDLRKRGELLQTLPCNAKSLDFSQKGLLSTACGSSVHVFVDSSGSQNYSHYMSHPMAKGYQIQKACFRPYEDVLAIGHSMGWSSILVPGSGEPNFDSWVANPFETRKQRNEKEIHSLLDKLLPETIMLDPTKIGSVKPTRKREKPSRQEKDAEMEAAVEEAKSKSFKKKTKGRSKPSKMARKKQEAIVRAKKPLLEQQAKEEESSTKKRKIIGGEEELQLPKSLQRFSKKAPKS